MDGDCIDATVVQTGGKPIILFYSNTPKKINSVELELLDLKFTNIYQNQVKKLKINCMEKY